MTSTARANRSCARAPALPLVVACSSSKQSGGGSDGQITAEDRAAVGASATAKAS